MHPTPFQTFIVVPAAGNGQRMQQFIAKQYLHLAGKPVLTHTLETLLAVPAISQLIIALAPDDLLFDRLISITDPRLIRIKGGVTRAASVLNALNHLNPIAKDDDWVLVHDAARPFISQQDIAHLRSQLAEHPVGGLLATPVTDTLKQVDADLTIQKTLNRQTLWRALTPQMCRYGLLKAALNHCLAQQITITDEAMAMEQCNHAMQIIEGSSDNIKITYPIDLMIAEQLIKH